MRLAISNIAWEPAEDVAVLELLHRHAVDAIDIAPGKYFPEPRNTASGAIARVRRWWAERGIEITGMQALLFGTTGLNVFGDAQVQTDMLQHLDAVCRIASGLGATRLVFGSPKNRDRSGLDDRQAEDIACAFFSQLGAIALSHGVLICLEPNPPCYGANFMINSDETAHIVRCVSHAAVKLQLDIGALTINREDPDDIIARNHELIGHIHASEPNLVPLGDGGASHAQAAAALARRLPGALVSIEMLSPHDEGSLNAIERALQVADQAYRQSPPV